MRRMFFFNFFFFVQVKLFQLIIKHEYKTLNRKPTNQQNIIKKCHADCLPQDVAADSV